MSGYQNPNVAEVEHDTKLLDLLHDRYQAQAQHMFAAQRVREFAGEYRRDVAKVNYGRTRTVTWPAVCRDYPMYGRIDAPPEAAVLPPTCSYLTLRGDAG